MLRKYQTLQMFQDPTPDSIFRHAFGLPFDQHILAEINAVFSLLSKPDSYSGKLSLTDRFLTFVSLDRRSCRFSLPLATIRKVERIPYNAYNTQPSHQLSEFSAGVFAICIVVWHDDLKFVLKLNGLKPTCESFCMHLRTHLKAIIPEMKMLKAFVSTIYSEHFLSGSGDDVATFTTSHGVGNGHHAGLGEVYRYPGDTRKLREKSKLKLWKDYLSQNGRNLTLVKFPTFIRLVQVGLPNRLRGEIWEISTGSLYLRQKNPGEYARILSDIELNKAHKLNFSLDEIEKDLNRSLPEYPAYQAQERGIGTLRNVLSAYAWKNPRLGYCQAMNIVVAALLIYTSEEQCFYLLSILCDQILPSYYTPSMAGTILDQKVFEHLVETTLPMIAQHFRSYEIQLSLASLPWFLSLYLASMPLVFAFRIVDCVMLFGPRVLFQIGLAILKINGPALLQIADDGGLISTMRAYFQTLGDTAYPNSSPTSKERSITHFQILLVTAFREFGNSITDGSIESIRKKMRSSVVESIETFSKRTCLRNLKGSFKLDSETLGRIYDHVQLAIYKCQLEISGAIGEDNPQNGVGGGAKVASFWENDEKDGKLEQRITRATFGVFMGDVARWARDETLVKSVGFVERIERVPVDHELIDRLFKKWDRSKKGSLSLEDIAIGLDKFLGNDLMGNLEGFFGLHDSDSDGYLTKDEVLQLSESLLFIFRNEPGDHYLAAVSKLMQNGFEFADAMQKESKKEGVVKTSGEEKGEETLEEKSKTGGPGAYLGLSMFRMCVLADELLESFFETDFTRSWTLAEDLSGEAPRVKSVRSGKGLAELVPDALNQTADGILNGFKSRFLTETNKGLFYKFADEVGKKLDIPKVDQKLPAIGKLGLASQTSAARDRESILPSSMLSSLFGSAQQPGERVVGRRVTEGGAEQGGEKAAGGPPPLSHAAMRSPPADMHLLMRSSPVEMDFGGSGRERERDREIGDGLSQTTKKRMSMPPPPPLIQRAQSMIVDRPQFAIDNPVAEEEVDEEEEGVEGRLDEEMKKKEKEARSGMEENNRGKKEMEKDEKEKRETEEEALMAEVDQFLANGDYDDDDDNNNGNDGGNGQRGKHQQHDDDDELEEAQKLLE